MLKKKEQTIKKLNRHHLIQASDAGGHNDAAHSATTLEVEGFDTTEMLLELGQSLRRSETVADIGPQLRQATRRTIPSRRRPDPEILRSDTGLINPTPPPPQLRRTRQAIHITEETRERPEPRIIIPERALQRFEVNVVEDSRDDATDVHSGSEVSAHSTLLAREPSASSAPTTPETPITSVTPGPAASSFEDVRERTNYHSLVLLKGEAIQGYLSKPNRPRGPLRAAVPVTVRRFGPDLKENFISRAKARELGLDIELLDPEADGGHVMVLVDVEGNSVVHRRAIGTVEVAWWTSRPPGFTLMMWVLEGGLPDGIDIALGRPYEKKRRRYNRAPSVSERS